MNGWERRDSGRGWAARACGAFALAALAGACASTGELGPAVAGCYQFRYDEGSRALGLPWGVELLDEPLEGTWPITSSYEDVRRALTATSATEREDHPLGYWRWTEADSVEIGYPAGGAGFTLVLAPEGDDLSGSGRPVGDALPPDGSAGPSAAQPVLAQRVVCGAP